MSAKLKSRILVTKGKSTVNHTDLPPELGGNGESYSELTKYWKEYTQRNAKWFTEDDKYKSVL